jgi:hypothetical protein
MRFSACADPAKSKTIMAAAKALQRMVFPNTTRPADGIGRVPVLPRTMLRQG